MTRTSASRIGLSLSLALGVALGSQLPLTPLAAEATSISLAINKRVDASAPNALTQTTAPLAGAHYRVTRIQPTDPKQQVDGAKPDTYRVLGGPWAFSVELVTDANGRAQIGEADGLVNGAYYLIEELVGHGISKATQAKPVAVMFDQEHLSYTYTPKSGLGFIPGHPDEPDDGKGEDGDKGDGDNNGNQDGDKGDGGATDGDGDQGGGQTNPGVPIPEIDNPSIDNQGTHNEQHPGINGNQSGANAGNGGSTNPVTNELTGTGRQNGDTIAQTSGGLSSPLLVIGASMTALTVAVGGVTVSSTKRRHQ